MFKAVVGDLRDMVVEFRTITDTYQDSVKLMRVSSTTLQTFDVDQAVAMMGTEENMQTLRDMELFDPADLEDVRPDDLVLAVQDDDPETAAQAIDDMEEAVAGEADRADRQDRQEEQPPRSLYGALNRLPEANLALVSVPGQYAAREAWKALNEGLHVQVFSDNVAIEDERALKEYGREQELLVMGPDCGTAIVNGQPLGFANEVDDGPIGVVAAAGSGLQEVTSLIDRAGSGVSQAIGTGGRDLKDEVGGITMQQGLSMLESDDETDVILLISKPPDPETAEELLAEVDECQKPVVVDFIGSDPEPIESAGGIPTASLADAARTSIEELPGDGSDAAADFADGIDRFTDPEDPEAVLEGRSGPDAERRFLRGLYSGGTLASEAATLLEESVDGVLSNDDIEFALGEPIAPDDHSIVDLGADEFTRGRPHPMIDSTIRDEQLRYALESDDALVVLLDVVLGYGAADDPAGAIVDLLSEADHGDWPVVIASVCGTRGDPQPWADQVETLADAGVHVAESNADAVGLAETVLASAAVEGGDSR